VRGGGEAGRELKKKGAELSGLRERLERGSDPGGELCLEIGVRDNVSPLVYLGGAAEVAGEGSWLGGVPGEVAVKLDVEGEPSGGLARPALGLLAPGDGVEARV